MTEREEALATLTARADQVLKEVQDGRATLRQVSRLVRELGDLCAEALADGDVSVAHDSHRLRRRLRMAAGMPGRTS